MRSIRYVRSLALLTVVLSMAAAEPTRASASAVPQAGQVRTSPVKVIATIPVGPQPIGVAVDPATDMIYVANSGDGTLSVINGRTSKVTATIQVGNGVSIWEVAVNPATDTVYVANLEGRALAVIDGKTNAVTASTPAPTCTRLAVNPVTGLVYDNILRTDTTVLDGQTGAVVTTIAIKNPWGAAADPQTDTLYVANDANNTVALVDGQTNAITGTVKVGLKPADVAVNQRTGLVYVANNTANTVSVLGS